MAEENTTTTETPPQQQTSQPGDHGFPANTPLADMNAEQQAAYWKHQARKHESTVKDLGKRYGDYDSLRERAGQYDALLRTTQTDQERAVADARKTAAEEARAAAQAEFGGQLVAARLQTALAGRRSAEEIDALIEGVDPARFLKDGGQVDTEKVATWVDRVAPKRPTDLGQGSRGGAEQPQNMNHLIRRAAGYSN